MKFGEEHDEKVTLGHKVQAPFFVMLLLVHVLEQGVVVRDGPRHELRAGDES